MKKLINVLCVLILALTTFDLIWEFFFSTTESGATPTVEAQSLSFGAAMFVLFIILVALASVVACFVCFIKFVLNVNRNQVFTKKNVSLLRKYGAYAILAGACLLFLIVYLGIPIDKALTDSLDTFLEGLFALLMGEVFGIGLKLQEDNKTLA